VAAPDRSVLRALLTDLRNAVSGAEDNLIATGGVNKLNLILGTDVPTA